MRSMEYVMLAWLVHTGKCQMPATFTRIRHQGHQKCQQVQANTKAVVSTKVNIQMLGLQRAFVYHAAMGLACAPYTGTTPGCRSV